MDIAEQKMPDAVGKGITLPATNLGRVAQDGVGHRGARDRAGEDCVPVHWVRGIGKKFAVVILAADLE